MNNCTTAAPAAAYALRDLVGGVIITKEIRREGREKHYLQGTFTIKSLNVACAVSNSRIVDEYEAVTVDVVEEIMIDFVDPNPLEEQAIKAWSMHKEGMLGADIAECFHCSRSNVTKLLKQGYVLTGEEMPDGRSRRSTLARKHQTPPLFEAISEDAMRLFMNGLLIDEIAAKLKCDRATAKKAIDLAHERRGLSTPDGRALRKGLDHKKCRPPEEGRSDGDDDTSDNGNIA